VDKLSGTESPRTGDNRNWMGLEPSWRYDPMKRELLFLWLWLIWLAVLVSGAAYALFGM
jgi:hypothetical protein